MKENATAVKKTGTIPPASASVLIVEDHPLNQMFLKKALERFGVGRFEVVPNGMEAFKKYTAAHWDLILMDCHMPGMDGYEATRAIRGTEEKTGKHVTIIAMTASTTDGEREKCLACGMDEYIAKPINVGELRHLLSNWLQFDDEDEAAAGQKTNWNHQTPVDISKLRLFAEQGSTLEKEMVRLFVEQSDQNMEALRKGCAHKNYKMVKEAAHMFKGGAGSLGAGALSQLCDRMEVFEGTDGGRMALVEGINKEYSRVKHYLEELDLLERKN